MPQNPKPKPVDIPGIGSYEIPSEGQGGSFSMGDVLNVGRNMSPEIVAGLAAALGPESGGLSLAIPPVAAGLTEALKQWSDTGSVSPTGVAGRAALNLVPGLTG